MNQAIKTSVGVLGGGQLGRMLGVAAERLGVQLVVLDPQGANSPAGQVCPSAIEGHFNDAEKVRRITNLHFTRLCNALRRSKHWLRAAS